MFFDRSIYVGCALTNAPEKFRGEVEQLKEEMGQFCRVLKFLDLKAGTNREVFTHDIIRCVGNCDGMLAITDYPSTGLGWEMCETLHLGKPLLAVAHEQSRVTRLILDPGVVGYTFLRYHDLRRDVSRLVIEWLLSATFRRKESA